MSKTIEFSHSAFADSYEKQANAQGYTFGEDTEFVQRVGDGLLEAWFHKCITDTEYVRILDRFQKKILMKNLKKIEAKKDDDSQRQAGE